MLKEKKAVFHVTTFLCYKIQVHVIADVCIIPIGPGTSLSPYVAACVKVLKSAGLKTNIHAHGTNVEGEWDAVFGAIKRCHEVVHQMGVVRISTSIKVGTRTDKNQSMQDKINAVKSP